MLPHHGLIFLTEFDEDQTKIVDLSLFLCLWEGSLKEKKERMKMIKDYYVKNVEFPKF